MQLPHPRLWRFSAAIAATLVSMPVMLWVPANRYSGALIARVLLSHYVFGAVVLLSILIAASIEVRLSLWRLARWRSEISPVASVGFPRGA